MGKGLVIKFIVKVNVAPLPNSATRSGSSSGGAPQERVGEASAEMKLQNTKDENIIYTPCKLCGGGVGFVIKDDLNFTKLELPKYSSFECIGKAVKVNDCVHNFLTVHHSESKTEPFIS